MGMSKLVVFGPDEDTPNAKHKVQYECGPMLGYRTVAVCTDEKEAKFIKTACNSHDILVAALRRINDEVGSVVAVNALNDAGIK